MAEVLRDFIPSGRHNRPGRRMIPQWITIHDTANPSPRADALAHARYLKGAAADVPASWHFTVDDVRVIQHLPVDEVAYHAGDGAKGPGNTTSIGIEICENSGGDRPRAELNACRLIADLLRQCGLGTDRVVPHKKWSGKNCPHLILHRWDEYMHLIEVATMETPGTPILGMPLAAMDQARRWAAGAMGTAQFTSIVDIYWKYGNLYGIRPDVMYAQAAKETAFGRYGGAVTPDMHNFAGIKVLRPAGDAREDHETFPDDDTGVHAHFQHMAAYVGLAPIGARTHPRQDVVRAQRWAGTIRNIEDLSGKWAPDPRYGDSIVRDYLQPMLATTTGADAIPAVEYRMVPGDRDLPAGRICMTRESTGV
ncbi:MAG: N-acetylmuramoyl-L-alanine amidase [Ignavibacteriales bacterium]